MTRTVSCPTTARALLADDRLVILATEATGRAIRAVALLDRHGHVLLHTRIRPACPDAPPRAVVWPPLAALLTGRIVVSMHLARDRRLLRQAARRLGATLMYSAWCSLAELVDSGPRAAACWDRAHPLPASHAALAEAHAALAALRVVAAPPLTVPPSRHVFWRYL
ncbi:MAG TPA: hypothetical protein VFZ66_13705 [Herpetosiphonaceae bacterium]